MTTQWKVRFDWNRDGSFDQTYDDQSARIIRAQWMLGLYEPYQEIAGDMMLQLVLRNHDGLFSPENTSSPISDMLNAQVPVQVVAHDGAIERIMWTG